MDEKGNETMSPLRCLAVALVGLAITCANGHAGERTG